MKRISLNTDIKWRILPELNLVWLKNETNSLSHIWIYCGWLSYEVVFRLKGNYFI
mgnify:CR=1 FL=1